MSDENGSERGQCPELGMRETNHLEKLPHAEAGRAGEAFERRVDLRDLRWRDSFAQYRCAVFNAEIVQERSLFDRAENPRSHALSGLSQRLKIDMRGQVDGAWRLQRVNEGMLA